MDRALLQAVSSYHMITLLSCQLKITSCILSSCTLEFLMSSHRILCGRINHSHTLLFLRSIGIKGVIITISRVAQLRYDFYESCNHWIMNDVLYVLSKSHYCNDIITVSDQISLKWYNVIYLRNSITVAVSWACDWWQRIDCIITSPHSIITWTSHFKLSHSKSH